MSHCDKVECNNQRKLNEKYESHIFDLEKLNKTLEANGSKLESENSLLKNKLRYLEEQSLKLREEVEGKDKIIEENMSASIKLNKMLDVFNFSTLQLDKTKSHSDITSFISEVRSNEESKQNNEESIINEIISDVLFYEFKSDISLSIDDIHKYILGNYSCLLSFMNDQRKQATSYANKKVSSPVQNQSFNLFQEYLSY